MNKAAGILFLCPPTGHALFLKRSATAAHCPGCWDFPGGAQENDETAEQTATREAEEEVGFLPKGDRVLHTRTVSAPPGAAGIGAAAVLPVQPAAPASPEPVAMDYRTDFTTFVQRVGEEFVPELNDEHDGWAWAPIDSPPQPLHPGCQIALSRITMNELDVARAIADGRLVSPQRYENMWLFAIRITGTGVSYRNTLDEFVVRRPENYLNDDFLARCNGLTVVYLRRDGTKRDGFHPKGALLNSEEFERRVVGSIFLPYIAGAEVWGIAKIYDDAAAEAMLSGQLSTSPSVFFRNVSVNATVKLEDGTPLLIEGAPSLLDHVCICEQGVWDKGGEPTGVRSESRGDSAMPTPAEIEAEKAKKDAEEKARKDAEEKEREEKEKADKAKKDAEDAEAKKKADADAGTTLDKTLKSIGDSMKTISDTVGSLTKRMDAAEADQKARKDAEEEEKRKKGDPEQLAADKAKKDAEEKEAEEKRKSDAAKADEARRADAEATAKRIADLEAKMPKALTDADFMAVTDAQARADSVYQMLGSHAPRPLQGETVAVYERRVVRDLKQHSGRWKASDVGAVFADDTSFGVVRDQVYEDAIAHAKNPANILPGQLRMVEKRDGSHTVREFHGEPRTWMSPMAGPVVLKATGAWNTPGSRPN